METALQIVLKRIRDAEKLGRPAPSGSIFRQKGRVERTPEFLRIASMLSRDWEANAEYLVSEMTPLLKTPTGTQVFRPVQAAVLHDLAVYGGVVGIVRVGGGKTLVCFLAPYCVQAARPLLVVPGSLLGSKRNPGKTERDLERYQQHWKIPRFIRIVSYEWLTHKYRANFFDEYRPDLVMFDEAHKLKDRGSVVTKRVGFYREDCITYHEMLETPEEKWSKRMREVHAKLQGRPYPWPKFLVMSGTLTKNSLLDYWHLLRWALPPELVPLPIDYPEVIRWARALDARVGELNRVHVGAILDLCSEEERKLAQFEPLRVARQAYRRRLHTTPGVVCSLAAYEAASLRIQAKMVTPPDVVRAAFRRLRDLNETPDGWELPDGPTAAQRAMEMAQGFYLKWDPRPPREWVLACSEWNSVCRYLVGHNKRRLVSESQIVEALDRGVRLGRRTEEAIDKLATWRAVRPTFEPNVVPVWMSDFAIEFAAKWAEKERGIVWVKHPAVGERLSKLTRIPYYHRLGLDAEGRFIEDHPAGKPMIASMQSNMIGKNLQKWNTALLMYAPSSGDWYEQIIGREHREEQLADEVVVDLFTSCVEHVAAFWKARGDGEYVEDSALKHKLLFADVTIPRVEEVVGNGEFWTEFDPQKGT